MLLPRLTRSTSAWRPLAECAICPRVSHASIRQRRNLHIVPTLPYEDEFVQKGIASSEQGKPLLSPEAFKIAWTDYQALMVQKLNQITVGFDAENASMKQLTLQYARNPATASLFNHASMANNNTIFFRAFSPAPSKLAQYSALQASLIQAFGSIQTLEKTMLKTADAMFGPGFVWLVAAKDRNNKHNYSWKILTTYLAGTPYAEAGYRQQGQDMNVVANTAGSFGAASAVGRKDASVPPGAVSVTPVLCVSTWEHVYLHDYGVGGKQEYLKRWWDAINWGEVDVNTPSSMKDMKLGQFTS